MRLRAVGVRFGTLVYQCRALDDAEAVLFVGDGQSEPPVVHVRLNERVGADDDVDPAAAQPFVNAVLLCLRQRAGQQLHPKTERRKQRRQ